MTGTVLGTRDANKIKVFSALRLSVPRGRQKISSHVQGRRSGANARGGLILKEHLAMYSYPDPEGARERLLEKNRDEAEEVKQ